MMASQQSLRDHLVDLLTWRAAHAEFDRAVKNVPPEMRGRCPRRVPYSLWQLLEHIRRAQWDIVEFCRNTDYQSPKWPDDFWPIETEPIEREDWQDSIDSYKRDRQAMIDLIRDDAIDVHDRIRQGESQTYLREVLLVADHNSYHIGQMVFLRRILGIWPP
jgi:uncharacterized damage-inducible protein DinB